MIYLTGDTHGNPSRLSTERFSSSRDMTKNDFIIILGDFGMIWNSSLTKEEKYWIDWLEEKPWTTLFLDGNHENFTRIDALPQKKKFGGKVGIVNEKLIHLKRGEIYNIDNNKFFVFGGGDSIDKAQRTAGISWWDRELPNYAEYNNGLDNLKKHNFKVDYILTHDCPTSIYKSMRGRYHILKNEDLSLPKFFEEIKSKTSFIRWYFGHFHFNDTLDKKFSCLYEMVVELGHYQILSRSR